MTSAPPIKTAQLDHLVVWAHTLDEGVSWAEQTLGVTPGPGGKHPLMGTHNRLLNVASPAFAQGYLEIIAIDPEATPLRQGRLKRWFDMDDPGLQKRIEQDGPQLIHWVASVPALDAAVQTLAAQNIDRGAVLQASRMTPAGLLAWQISVRDDGQRLLDGCLPTLIEWGAVHPTQHMPASGVTLQALELQHTDAPTLKAALTSVGLGQYAVQPGQPSIIAALQTPLGLVTLRS